MLSQESPTLTAHRPSFPTCLFHPRRMHLLCHLDSPSAANLPYLGLQEQTGPEVSGLYGSYRVPSRSSLLPLRTLSPGGSRSQANKPHAVQYCVVSTIPRENRHRLSKNWFGNHRMASQSRLRNRECSHRLAQLSRTSKDSSPKSTQASRRLGLHARDFSESDTDIRVTGSHEGSLQESG
jgi:hypothetical protein